MFQNDVNEPLSRVYFRSAEAIFVVSGNIILGDLRMKGRKIKTVDNFEKRPDISFKKACEIIYYTLILW